MIAPANLSQDDTRRRRPPTQIAADGEDLPPKRPVITRTIGMHPVLVLATAVMAGATLGWFVKRKLR